MRQFSQIIRSNLCHILVGFCLSLIYLHMARAEQKTPLVALAAKKIGIQACLPAITQLATANTAGAVEQDIAIDWNRHAPNSAPFFTMTAMNFADGRAVLTITAIPMGKRGCALTVQKVFSRPESCSVIAQRDLAAYAGGALINGVLIFSNPARPEETYTLMQNSNNCTIIFRNDIPQWPLQR